MEALAGYAAARRTAVFSPRVATPQALVFRDSPPGAASRVESLLVWAEIFLGLDLEQWRGVFPMDPPQRGVSWAQRLAAQFINLQAALAEAGLRVADVADRAGGDFPEAPRWRELAELESLYDRKLGEVGLIDRQAASISAAESQESLREIDRIVVLATPDPLPLALRTLAAWAKVRPVEIAVFAPPAAADRFDGWGCPLPDAWNRQQAPLGDFQRDVHLCANPGDQAGRIARLAAGYAEAGSAGAGLGVGVADAEVLPFLAAALAQVGLSAFNPEGRLRSRDPLYSLLCALGALAREPAFAAVEALGRCPDFLEYLRARVGGFSAGDWLEGLDALRSLHLPADLEAARAHAAGMKDHPKLGPALDAVEEVRAALAGGSFAQGAAGTLEMIFASRQLDRSRPDHAALAESAAAWMALLRECSPAFPCRWSGADWWDLALSLFGRSAAAEEKPPGAVELQGWLELLWEDAPHLVVAGFNDGRVPEAIAGDPFLPESLRERIGLRTNAERFARDGFILAAIAGVRSRSGKLDILVGKASEAGEPLRPSRFLLLCPDSELPRRVESLFGPTPEARPGPHWRRAWLLRTPPAPRLTRLSVTAFRDYLQCPYRFYLKHALKFGTVDPRKSELDNLDFGVLCHAALEELARQPRLRESDDASVLRRFILQAFEREVRLRYGPTLTLPLVIQFESARQRLSLAAGIQAEARAQGWVVERTEERFALDVGGLAVAGRIDRVERHEKTGAFRLLDYKTSDMARSPSEAHLRPARAGEAAPEWARCEFRGRAKVWSDLQLSLYYEGFAANAPAPGPRRAEPPVLGYFNLPKAAGEAGISLWEDYTPELHAAAMHCASEVAAAVRAGVFWPPAELGERDDEAFYGLFHEGAADSVDPGFVGELPR